MNQRDRIYGYIRRRPKNGATRRELEHRLGLLHQSVGPRVVELVAGGWVRHTGEFRDGCEILKPTRRKRG